MCHTPRTHTELNRFIMRWGSTREYYQSRQYSSQARVALNARRGVGPRGTGCQHFHVGNPGDGNVLSRTSRRLGLGSSSHTISPENPSQTLCRSIFSILTVEVYPFAKNRGTRRYPGTQYFTLETPGMAGYHPVTTSAREYLVQTLQEIYFTTIVSLSHTSHLPGTRVSGC